MAQFTDKKNRTWIVDLDVYLVEQIHKRVEGVRIDALLGNEFTGLSALFADPVLLVRVLWVLVEEQAEKKAVGPEEFGRALGGDALEGAGTAFVQAVADFSPRQQRAVLKALLAKGQEIQAHQTGRVLAEIEALSPEPSPPVTRAADSSDSALTRGG